MEISQSFVDQLVSSITTVLRDELRRVAGTQDAVSTDSFANTLQSAVRQAAGAGTQGAANIAASSSASTSAGASTSTTNAVGSQTPSAVDQYGLSAADRTRLAVNESVIADAGFLAEDLDSWVESTISGIRWRASQSGADTSGLDKRQMMALAELETQSDLTADGKNRVIDQALVDRVRSLGNLDGVRVYSALGSLDLEAEVARARAASSSSTTLANFTNPTNSTNSTTSSAVTNTTSTSGISLADLVRNSIESQIARLGT